MMMKKKLSKRKNLLLTGVEVEVEAEEEVEVVEVVRVQVMMGQQEAVLEEGRDRKSRKRREIRLLNQIKTKKQIHRLQQSLKPIHPW